MLYPGARYSDGIASSPPISFSIPPSSSRIHAPPPQNTWDIEDEADLTVVPYPKENLFKPSPSVEVKANVTGQERLNFNDYFPVENKDSQLQIQPFSTNSNLEIYQHTNNLGFIGNSPQNQSYQPFNDSNVPPPLKVNTLTDDSTALAFFGVPSAFSNNTTYSTTTFQPLTSLPFSQTSFTHPNGTSFVTQKQQTPTFSMSEPSSMFAQDSSNLFLPNGNYPRVQLNNSLNISNIPMSLNTGHTGGLSEFTPHHYSYPFLIGQNTTPVTGGKNIGPLSNEPSDFLTKIDLSKYDLKSTNFQKTGEQHKLQSETNSADPTFPLEAIFGTNRTEGNVQRQQQLINLQKSGKFEIQNRGHHESHIVPFNVGEQPGARRLESFKDTFNVPANNITNNLTNETGRSNIVLASSQTRSGFASETNAFENVHYKDSTQNYTKAPPSQGYTQTPPSQDYTQAPSSQGYPQEPQKAHTQAPSPQMYTQEPLQKPYSQASSPQAPQVYTKSPQNVRKLGSSSVNCGYARSLENSIVGAVVPGSVIRDEWLNDEFLQYRLSSLEREVERLKAEDEQLRRKLTTAPVVTAHDKLLQEKDNFISRIREEENRWAAERQLREAETHKLQEDERRWRSNDEAERLRQQQQALNQMRSAEAQFQSNVSQGVVSGWEVNAPASSAKKKKKSKAKAGKTPKKGKSPKSGKKAGKSPKN